MGSHYNPRVVTNGLVLHLDAANIRSYPGSGTAWTDLSGQGNNGTLTNGPTFDANNAGSIVFDGTNDYVLGSTFTGLGSSNRAVDVWFRIISLSPSGNRRVFCLASDNTSADTPALTIGYSTSLSSMSVGFGGPPYDGYIAGLSFSLSTWINISATVTGNSITGYINGWSIGCATNSGTVGPNPILSIARYSDFRSQSGNVNVSNFKLYSRSLTAAEIRQNFNATRGRFGI
jgi:hypothetical protein